MVPVMATAATTWLFQEDRGLRLVWNGSATLPADRGPLAATGSERSPFVNPDDSAAGAPSTNLCMGFLPPGVSDTPGVMLCPTLITS